MIGYKATIFYLLIHLLLVFPVLIDFYFEKSQILIKNLNLFLTLVLLIISGFRFQVGGDWFSYERYFHVNNNLTIIEAFKEIEYFYHLLIFIFNKLNLEFIWLNLTLQTILFFFLYQIIKYLKNVSLIYFILFPTVIFFFSYGFIRQGIACLIVYYGLLFIEKNNKRSELLIVFIILSIGFHMTSAFFFIIYLCLLKKKQIILISLSGIFLFIISVIIDSNITDIFMEKVRVYILDEYQSSKGYYYRYLINFSITSIYIFYVYEKLDKNLVNKFLFIISIVNNFLILPSLIFGITTIFDRILLFSLPAQLIIICKFLEVVKNKFFLKYLIILICTSFFLYFFIWINLNNNIDSWNYRMYHPIFENDLNFKIL